MRTCLIACPDEGLESEAALMRGEISRLSTATGFVIGAMMCSGFWSLIGLLAWHGIA